MKKLSAEETRWVETTLADMTLDECLGHLLCPEDRSYTAEQWAQLVKDVPLGSVFFGMTEPAHLRQCVETIQENSRIPVLIASDLEHGAGCMIKGCVDFPFSMALGAANDEKLIRRMGQATAREGRACGVHWTFGPVVDINYNPQNPVVNVRALSDKPPRVARLAKAWIEGMQEGNLLAATAKHFPGDGLDDRDQHLCTSVNHFTVEEWWKTFGKVWREVIDAGVLSIMSGHISFPAYEGLSKNPQKALPATLSRKLQINLLRKELGFEGVIVSDAAPMIGFSSRMAADQLAVENILAGSDVYLFCDPRRDFERLQNAVKSGRLREKRLRESVKRVLEMKARLGIHREVFAPLVSQREQARYQKDATALAEKSITQVRSSSANFVKLKRGAKVLTVTCKYVESAEHLGPELPVVDEELKRRGMMVEHLLNPNHNELIKRADEFDAIFVNLLVMPHSRIGTIRMTGPVVMPFWRAFWVGRSNVVFTSFGNPYVLYELPHLPNLLLTYGPAEVCQKTAVRVWLQEISPTAKSPVNLVSKQ